MSRSAPRFTFGIEEEYSLVDLNSRRLAHETPGKLLSKLKSALGPRFSTEYMRSQIEIGTSVWAEFAPARRELAGLRRQICELAEPFGLAPMAAATHPFSRWSLQRHRNSPRYHDIASSFQGVGRRMVINGLHVHVAVDDADARIQVMNAMRAYLPVLLALSGSSPFWVGEMTGLKSFRSAVNDATPRKGVPETFGNWKDFERTMGMLIEAGVMEDASKVWWDLRPSVRFPTLEMRITDVCPRIDDTMCIAALYRCLVRHLYRTRNERMKAPQTPLLLINENRWRAERYGVDEGLIDTESLAIMPLPDMIERLLETIAEDAAHFGCEAEVDHALIIARRGTSADRQIARYRKLRRQKLSHRDALKGVVDLLLEETAHAPVRREAKAAGEDTLLADRALT